MSGKKILNKINWQRVLVDDVKIIEPKKEALTAGIYAVFFVFVSIATGLIIKKFPLPILGAASLTDDFWYVFVFKFIFLLSIPVYWYYKKGYRLSDLMSVITGTGIPVFLVGLIFAIFWDRYRSILPLIVAHWGVDIIPSIISYLGVSY